MDIKELKEKIENKNLDASLLILVAKQDFFIPDQYIKEIASFKNLEVTYLDDLKAFLSPAMSLFADIDDSVLSVYKCKAFDFVNTNLKRSTNLIIVTSAISEKAAEIFKNEITEIPELEDWQLSDYLYSMCEGADLKDIDTLKERCNANIYRLENEVTKVSIFPEVQRKFLLKDQLYTNIASDISPYNIFNFTNALQKRDTVSVGNLLKEIQNMDVEPLGLVTILQQNFRKMISVWLNNNPTSENTGLKSNQLWAISKLPRVFNREQLLDIFDFLLSLDSKLKSGEILENYIVDLIVIKILTC